jgi:hypothetical protein
VNRPGNRVSHEGCVPWIDRAIELLGPHTDEITLRGDTDLAEALPKEAWQPLERLPRYEIETEPRRKAQRIKEAIVQFKGYRNKKLVGESVTQFDYQPLKCERSYRLVVVRKTSASSKGNGRSLRKLSTSSTSLTTANIALSRWWRWPTNVAIRKTSSSNSKTA